MTGRDRRLERVQARYVEQLVERLSPRDWSILATLDRVRLATGIQLERLHFFSLSSPRSQAVMRWRVLKRLADSRVLVPLDRRIGTSLYGSARLRYALDSAGQQLIRMRDDRGQPNVRRPRAPGERFAEHTLAVTELYVVLMERSRNGGFTVGTFQTEGDAYWPDGSGGWLKPDAFIRLELSDTDADYWWYEAELAVKSEPAIRSKLQAYLDFYASGQQGPDGIVPRVFIGVEKNRQQAVIESVVNSLPEPADRLFQVSALSQVADRMVRDLTTERRK